MASIGLLPAIALLAGAVCGLLPALSSPALTWALASAAAAGWITWYAGGRVPRPSTRSASSGSTVSSVEPSTSSGRGPHRARLRGGVLARPEPAEGRSGPGAAIQRLTVVVLVVAFFFAGAVLAADARDRALRTPLRTLLDREVGAFALEDARPGARHDPMPVRALLLEDASQGSDFTTLQAAVTSVQLRGVWRRAAGHVWLTVGGSLSPGRAGEWRAGRRVEASVTFRRPARYLNEGVPDFERDLALNGTTLFGSVKSGLLVGVQANGSRIEEMAGRVRRHVRRSVERWVARYDAVSAAIVTAVLIGDRTGLPDDIRVRLQAAGTYHVIAISGGNIAILAGLILAALLACGVTGRPAALVTLLLLLAYAQVVTAGASVWRATLMAVLYFGARLLDHRSPPWHALALAAAIVVCARPLDVRDAGFILTFGATAALLEGARRAAFTTPRHVVVRWLIASLAASLAAEIALLPVSAWTFSRVTSAGLLLNLAAVPLMTLVQVGGIVVSCLGGVETIAAPAGWVAHAAASGLVGSARLVDAAPWLATRVPPPSLFLVAAYYLGLAVALLGHGPPRACGVGLLFAAAIAIVTGQPGGWVSAARDPATLRVTVFDVGQGDATLLQFPDRSTVLVDTGGIPFGNSAFDVGSRVLSPALWARGVRGLDAVLLTHGDPDHIGGARSIVHDFAPVEVWEGIPVARHAPLREVLSDASARGAHIERRQAGEEIGIGGARVRVLHPPGPDWERPRVRNDDSVVLEVLYGDVAVLLLGDVGAGIERSILSRLTPARHRILKVGHHGSRTSTSRDLVEHWRPQIAIISCGRGNTFGHPAPEVLQRLESIGAAIYRTDRDGQVSIETDGTRMQVRTYVGETR